MEARNYRVWVPTENPARISEKRSTGRVSGVGPAGRMVVRSDEHHERCVLRSASHPQTGRVLLDCLDEATIVLSSHILYTIAIWQQPGIFRS